MKQVLLIVSVSVLTVGVLLFVVLLRLDTLVSDWEKELDDCPLGMREICNIDVIVSVDGYEDHEEDRVISDDPPEPTPNIDATIEPGIAATIVPSAVEHYNRATTHFDLNEYEVAIQEYDKAIQLDPNYIEAYIGRGIVYQDLGRDSVALDDLDKAIQLNPKDAHPYTIRSFLNSTVGQHQRAKQDAYKAVQLDPNYALAYVKRGYAYLGLGKVQAAVDEFDKTIQLAPDDSLAYAARSRALSTYTPLRAQADADKAKACSLDSKYC